MNVYTFQEELLIGRPVAVERSPCDRSGCDGTATWLIPEAALCARCADEYGVGGAGTYRVPVDELVGGPEWRAGRTAEYVDALKGLGSVERDDDHDEILERAIQRETDRLFAEWERSLAPPHKE